MALWLGSAFAWLFAPAISPNAAFANESKADTILVAAASNLRFALEELAANYLHETGTRIEVSYGSSGNLVRQIIHGAPFEIFMSADDGFAALARDEGVAQSEPKRYAVGRIGFFVPLTSPFFENPDLNTLVEALRGQTKKSLAIANPEIAPYGRAARQCLQYYGLWDGLKADLVVGENATQATQFATFGQIAGGIVPRALVAATPISAHGKFFLLPSGCHTPLHQSMILTIRATQEARDFFVFLSSPVARNALKSFGFDVPEAHE